jgi:hypothetical protein
MQSGAKSAIELKDWQVTSLSWAADNEHLYIGGILSSKAMVSLVGLDGKIKDIVTATSALSGPGRFQPSPDGRYLGFEFFSYDADVVMLENF